MKTVSRSLWKRAWLILAVVIVSLAALAASGKKDAWVVHEWGTFTSVQGSDGVTLEGLQHEEESLPGFVHPVVPYAHDGGKGFYFPALHVTQKMETPVLYFYTQEPRRVQVRVDFTGGLISQWYPAAQPKTPNIDNKRVDISQVKGSSLEWDVDLTPWTKDEPDDFPQTFEGQAWNEARRVASASVRTRTQKVEAERFLFYRGLGNFTLPVTVKAERNGAAILRNAGKHSLLQAYALEIKANNGRYVVIGKVDAERSASFSLGAVEFRNKEDVVAELKAVVHKALEDQGLFQDEATAMINTWSRQWFASPGTRVIYIVPREITDALLPLHIKPSPEEMVRVLVGRLEYITPEVEAKTIEALRDYHSPDEDTRADAHNNLGRFGRFLEPHLWRALAQSKDNAVQKNGKMLLEAQNPLTAP